MQGVTTAYEWAGSAGLFRLRPHENLSYLLRLSIRQFSKPHAHCFRHRI